jgi:Acetyltransferase (GNAT) domain
MQSRQLVLADENPDVIAPESHRADTGSAWQFTEIADQVAISDLAAQARAMLSFRHYQQDLDWQSLGKDTQDKMIAVIDADHDGIQGFLSVCARDSSIEHRFASIAVFRKRVRRFEAYEGVVTRRKDARGAIISCLATLAEKVPGNGVVFFEAVPTDSVLHEILKTPQGPIGQSFYVLPWGHTQIGRFRWSGSVEEYLKSIGGKNSRNLKQRARALMSDATVRCTVERFETPADVDRFLRDGIIISDNTYQKKLLGKGLSIGGKVEAQMRFAAARHAFLGHILYIDDAPVAFQYGFTYAKTSFTEQIGYDPKWADRNVGSVLFLEALRDLEKTQNGIEVFDLGQGMTMFKERTISERQAVGHYLLIKRTANGFVTYHAARTIVQATHLVTQILERLQVRDTLKAVLRRWTGHGHMR